AGSQARSFSWNGKSGLASVVAGSAVPGRVGSHHVAGCDSSAGRTDRRAFADDWKPIRKEDATTEWSACSMTATIAEFGGARSKRAKPQAASRATRPTQPAAVTHAQVYRPVRRRTNQSIGPITTRMHSNISVPFGTSRPCHTFGGAMKSASALTAAPLA